MSQSDYTKYKRVGTQLRIDSSWNHLLPVLSPQQYLDYKQYTLENTIINTKPLYHMQTPSGEINVFGFNRKTTNCPTFITCKNTNLRPNRVALSPVYVDPTPQPLTCKQVKAQLDAKRIQQDICDCSDAR